MYEFPAVMAVALRPLGRRTVTGVDDFVVDAFLGSGTTAYCAKKLNRRYGGSSRPQPGGGTYMYMHH